MGFFIEAEYKNSIGEIFTFGKDSGVYIGDSDIFNNEWDYSTVGGKISDFSRTYRGFGLDVYAIGENCDIDSFLDVIDYDPIENAKGTLTVNGWSIQGCFYKLKSKRQVNNRIAVFDFDFVTDSKMWRKAHTVQFRNVEQPAEDDAKQYPHGYNIDYGVKSGNSHFTVEGRHAAQFKLVFYGAATTPSVTINGHKYEVTATVQSGGYLIVDSEAKTCTLIGSQGEMTNVFSKQNLSSYIFEPLPIGNLSVSWTGDYGLDITYYEQRSVPEWN